MFTPIPEKEAATRLKKTRKTIYNATRHNILTRIPGTSQIQYVALEQVMLFEGKSQVTLDALSPDELTIWQRCRDEILQPQQTKIDEKQYADMITGVDFLARLGKWVREEGFQSPLSESLQKRTARV